MLQRAQRIGGFKIEDEQPDQLLELREQWIDWINREHPQDFQSDISSWDELEKERASVRQLRDRKAAEYRNSILRILDEKQKKRLAELQWQKFVTTEMVDCFRTERVVELLQLTTEQQKEIDFLVGKIESEKDRFKSTRT